MKLNSAAGVKVVVAFGYVLIVLKRTEVSWQKTETWILDLGDDKDEYKWIESRLHKDEHPRNGTSMILAKNGYIHFTGGTHIRNSFLNESQSVFVLCKKGNFS